MGEKRNFYKETMKQFVSQLGGKCVLCGSKKNLEFDHIDPDTKKYSIGHGWSRLDIQDELKKCQLLCRNCHIQKTIDTTNYGKPFVGNRWRNKYYDPTERLIQIMRNIIRNKGKFIPPKWTKLRMKNG